MTVLVTCPLPADALEQLSIGGHTTRLLSDGESLAALADRKALTGVRAIVCSLTDHIDRRVIDAAPDLAVVATVSVGHDHIDVVHAHRRGVVVCNTPGALDAATADVTMLLILAACRRASEAEHDLRSGTWPGWAPDQYVGHDLDARCLAIVGWGRIGRAVADRARGFGLRVMHHSRRPTGDPGCVVDLDDLLARADIVSIHVPLDTSTRHLIDARRLALMKPTAVLVNTSRGAVVDEAALAAALHAGRLSGAGLDVYEDEPHVHPNLLTAPNTTLLPHIGSATVATRGRMALLAVEAVTDVLAGRDPVNALDPRAGRSDIEPGLR